MAKAECERLSFRGSPFLSLGIRAFAFCLARRLFSSPGGLHPKGRRCPVVLAHLSHLVLSGGGSPCAPGPLHSSRFFCLVTEPFAPSAARVDCQQP